MSEDLPVWDTVAEDQGEEEEPEVWIEVCEELVIPIGEGYDFILFVLPALYVAKADGIMNFKETLSVTLSVEAFGGDPNNKEKIGKYNNVLSQFYEKSNLGDLKQVTTAINERLQECSKEESDRLRGRQGEQHISRGAGITG